MKSVLLIVGGVAVGFVAAHLINSTESGRAFFGRINDRVDAFTGAVRDGYDARTTELISAIDKNH